MRQPPLPLRSPSTYEPDPPEPDEAEEQPPDPLIGRLSEAQHLLDDMPELAARVHELAWWPPSSDPAAPRARTTPHGGPSPEPGDRGAVDDYRYAAALLTQTARELSMLLERRTPSPAEVAVACHSLASGAATLRAHIDETEGVTPAIRKAGGSIARAAEQANRALRRAAGQRQRRHRGRPSEPARRSPPRKRE